MRTKHFTFKDPLDTNIFVYQWLPEDEVFLKGIVQIAHGMAETAARYEHFAKVLTEAGYMVYANDHRGHGKTAESLEEVGYIGEDGFRWMVENMHQLNSMIQQQNPQLPIFLFGHSMGSFLAQRYIALYGDKLAGVILSGSNGYPGSMIHIAIYLAKREMNRKGGRAPSQFLANIALGSYNKAFTPARTSFDWLSRDEKAVDQYIGDPYCGTVFPTSFYYYLFQGLHDNFRKNHLENIPKDLPIYIFSGEKDPVGKNGKGVLQLVETYRKYNIKDIVYRLYPEGRHEMLNEINRDEVMANIIEWLDQQYIYLCTNE